MLLTSQRIAPVSRAKARHLRAPPRFQDGQPLSFSASSEWGASTRFRLQIGMITRCEQSFGTPQGVAALEPGAGRAVERAPAEAWLGQSLEAESDENQSGEPGWGGSNTLNEFGQRGLSVSLSRGRRD